MLMKEMKSMDSTYVSLQKELKANPNDERIINAMIEHYQTKLEVMSYIVNQLKQSGMITKIKRKMKKLNYKPGMFFLISLFLISSTISADEVTKEFHKEYTAGTKHLKSAISTEML